VLLPAYSLFFTRSLPDNRAAGGGQTVIFIVLPVFEKLDDFREILIPHRPCRSGLPPYRVVRLGMDILGLVRALQFAGTPAR
jgi:hypothetical protein